MSPRETILDSSGRPTRRFLAILRDAGVRLRPDTVIVDRSLRPLAVLSDAIRGALTLDLPPEAVANPDGTVSVAFYNFWRRATA